MNNYPACKEKNISQVLAKESFLLKSVSKRSRFHLYPPPFWTAFIETQFLHALIE